MSKFRHHKYMWSKPFMGQRHHWELVGPMGALHLHVSLVDGYEPSCGLEYHHTESCNYRPGTAPDHNSCPLTGGRCWHDGTSLYASETVWPHVSGYARTGDHERIFSYLERVYDDHFEQYEKGPDKQEDDE